MQRKFLVLIAVIIILGVVSIFAFNKKSEIENYPSSGTDIIAFGDSLVQGVGASSEDKNFVSLLSQKIDEPIINLGISGNTTEDGLKRINELDRYKPKVVLLLLGGNDRLRKVPVETTIANLENIIKNIQARGSVVLLLGVRGNLITDNFDTVFENLRDKYKTAYVPDVLDGIFGNGQYMSDSIHPNDAGYEIIANKIHPVLLEVI